MQEKHTYHAYLNILFSISLKKAILFSVKKHSIGQDA